MSEKEKIAEILDILREYCENSSCDYCVFRTDCGACRFKRFAEIRVDDFYELRDFLNNMEE